MGSGVGFQNKELCRQRGSVVYAPELLGPRFRVWLIGALGLRVQGVDIIPR